MLLCTFWKKKESISGFGVGRNIGKENAFVQIGSQHGHLFPGILYIQLFSKTFKIQSFYSRHPKSERSDFSPRNFSSVVEWFVFRHLSEIWMKMFGFRTLFSVWKSNVSPICLKSKLSFGLVPSVWNRNVQNPNHSKSEHEKVRLSALYCSSVLQFWSSSIDRLASSSLHFFNFLYTLNSSRLIATFKIPTAVFYWKPDLVRIENAYLKVFFYCTYS